MEIWGYLVISSYVFPLGVGLALWIQKRLLFTGLILWAYLLFTLLIEIISAVLANNGVNTLWLFRIYLYAELIFPTVIFYNQFSSLSRKKVLLVAFALSVILTTLINSFDNWKNEPSLQTAITFAYITFTIISYFIEMFRTEKVFNPFKNIYFMVGATLLVGNSCALIYNVLFDYLASGYFGDQVHFILNGVNWGLIVFYNLLYSYILWISRNPQI